MKSHTMVLAVLLSVPGCMPSSGQATRDTSDDAPAGAGKASASWELDRRTRNEPSESDVRSMQNAPLPPSRE